MTTLKLLVLITCSAHLAISENSSVVVERFSILGGLGRAGTSTAMAIFTHLGLPTGFKKGHVDEFMRTGISGFEHPYSPRTMKNILRQRRKSHRVFTIIKDVMVFSLENMEVNAEWCKRRDIL